MPNLLYIYILNMICKHILLITFLNEPEFICLHTVKWFQVFLSNTNNSINYYSFISSQLNGSKYCYVSLTNQLNIGHLFTHS